MSKDNWKQRFYVAYEAGDYSTAEAIMKENHRGTYEIFYKDIHDAYRKTKANHEVFTRTKNYVITLAVGIIFIILLAVLYFLDII